MIVWEFVALTTANSSRSRLLMTGGFTRDIRYAMGWGAVVIAVDQGKLALTPFIQ
jgi:hypothetical protein